jgi:hypothetical protein
MTTLIKEKFNIQNPHQFLRDLKKLGKIDSRTLRNVFEDTSPEKFDVKIVEKYVFYVSSKENARGIQYDPVYWMYRCNISYEEALERVEKLKTDKVTSKEGFIRRHGEEKGMKMFEKFQATSGYSSSNEWFKNKYGDEWENKKEYELKRKSKRRVEYWTHRGFSLDEAKEKVREYQRTTSGMYRDFYIQYGYTEDEIDIILNEINIRKTHHSRNRIFLKQKYPDNWKEIYEQNEKKYRKRMEELGVWIERDLISDYK